VEKAGPLSATFWLECSGEDRPAGAEPALEAELAAACTRGRAAFDPVALDDRAFVRHLAKTLRATGSGPIALPSLSIEDLYLACACLAGSNGAAARFSARHGQAIRTTIARLTGGADAGEVEQRLLDALLVGSVTSPPKIGSYAGRAPLDRWLAVAAQRAALMWRRENRTEARARSRVAAEVAIGGGTAPEMAYLKERYREDFERALRESLERLPEQERTLLRLHVLGGVSVEKIGKMFAVSQATASRRLAAARGALLDDIKATLGTRLGASSAELASLAAMVASRLDLSLSALLKPG
jgi:RNA polymerase sigma-70 factor (ECF subfamily)